MQSRPTVVVLAAGKGSRFKGPAHKLEQSLGGLSVLGRTLHNALESHLPVVVVTTQALAAGAAQVVAARDVVIVPEALAALGMGHSIAAGIAARADAPGWLLLPGDMPMVRPATMLAVAAALEHHPVAYAQYHGRRGHPVGFAAELYSELMMLSGDEGARRIVARYPAVGVDVDDPGTLLDLDTEADFAALLASGAFDSRSGAAEA
ncbi:MAG TPA: nucleotidyltransferase family protein [Rubrivivax sp.]|nr:nucleotidyltransferase family protein [Rubrivivax sp.]